MKITPKVLLASILAGALLTACGNTESEPKEEKAEESADVVTTASIVNEADALTSALSENGTWIVATLQDLTVDSDIVVAGEFHDKGDAAKDIYRKLALYTQDDDRNIIDSFTLTAPKMTVQSENFKIQGGTFAGDVYVEANGFTVDATAKVDGNVYYKSDEFKASAVIDGEVTGAQEVQ
ncbi:polymer-forming cytoskeletal protein [Niallia sp. MER TA 168]|uniref:polymer-forming cytoskeletal protein n=1 Tax=Niallia sp. MER TA 168 TaxID=2939568 RepID=UPI00204257BB|nr:polymer-forming cytoskeletal protein [Niallia sp. MER TA 168]MCM3361906.1 polymer-forming cytoskeletal protein [Niallia sp. MER TA 168]